MSDLIDDPTPGINAPEFTVTELSGAVKRTIEGEFSHVRVRGEIGRVSRPRSGHIYLDLKDDRAVISGVIWKGVAARLATQPEEGLEVVATGRLTTFPGQSKYQIVIEDIAPAGMGALMAMLEKRKKALEGEGLFAAERKKPLPYLPEVIGVVTSPSGAVIRDILHRLRDRFPRKVLIWPVAVQGQKCAPEVTRAIEGFNRLTPGGALPRPDLLIVARGGGSIEDLWGFNEESVARAAAASDIPLISAVGHETDTTLIDFVSDRRAPTPTAAAELAVPVRMELLAWVDGQSARLTRGITQSTTQRGQRLRDLSRALPKPGVLVEAARQRLDYTSDRLGPSLHAAAQKKRVRMVEVSGSLRPASLNRLTAEAKRRLGDRTSRLQPQLLTRDIERKKNDLGKILARLDRVGNSQVAKWSTDLSALERMRQSLGYEETLKRGYAVVRSGDQVITTKSAAEKATALEIQFQDGSFKIGAKPSKPKSKPTPPPEQGTLL
ncbi:exodeoxyribonuclease VII large subunit [Actibacterium lipolyticum]|uniref:Exodeoxyribonuclease 7 large subunit n=1 Tax=Actibacterium lipolyticum TaxID=1524263 RepID=A0A238KKP5_9RHOB|nr:exodeoxyribonuclease VII large subunit [Actibacterium lipolyticum]SMX43353.1 Exodeoxyribonuclease 7 large subunit [Actibacterium lipolyticum]